MSIFLSERNVNDGRRMLTEFHAKVQGERGWTEKGGRRVEGGGRARGEERVREGGASEERTYLQSNSGNQAPSNVV